MQREIIDSVLSGHDTLGLLPTGAGKSVTFQVPGLVLGGVTLVVTPLIALMKDQVDNLREHGVKAAFLHSSMTLGETNQVWRSLATGHCSFLYVAPERLLSRRFLDELRTLKRITLVVADEAHCISQWGYDFRPAYLNIASLRKILPPSVPFLALTASATPAVADDICRVLRFKERQYFSTSFARPNISYVVRRTEDKFAMAELILDRVPGTSILYVRSRALTSEIAGELQRRGISALPFHAGLDFEVKEERIAAWKRGECRLMVATNAFGMGIDKPDVRTVIHWDLPPSLEEYYQEAGRAGRDGLPSFAVLLYTSYDKSTLRRHLTMEFPDRKVILKVYERVCNFLGIAVGEGYDRIYEFNLDLFIATFGMSPDVVLPALRILGQAGYMEYIDERENSSRIRILLTREDLYNVGGLSENAERVLSKVLRLYPGIFIDYVYINERRVASELKFDEQTVYDSMLELSRVGVLSYVPRSRTPYIYIPTSREEPRYVMIGKAVYEDRFGMQERRIEAMIDYAADGSSCRVERMLRYFGEPSARPCGTCDVCRAERGRKSELSDRELTTRVVAYLRERPRGVRYEALVAHIGHRYFGRIATLIAAWLQDGLAEMDGPYLRMIQND